MRTKEEILEGNKLIAEFISESKTPYSINGDFINSEFCNNNTCEACYYDYTEMEFHTSWDWLMPVVEKIEKLGFDSRIHGNNSDDGYLCDFVESNTNNEISCFVTWQDNGGTKIQATYKAVVEFIKRYNENKTK